MPFLSQKPIDGDYRNVKIFRCPSYPDKEQTVCYVVNGWPDNDNERTRFSKVTDCSRPGSTIYLADNEDGWWRTIITNASERDITRCDVFEPEHLPSSDVEAVSGGRRVARARHRNGCNVMYLDWHAGYMDAEEMTAVKEDIEEALKEGIRIEYLTSPMEILGDGTKVTGIRCQRMALEERGEDGRRKAIPVPASEFVMDADHVVLAIGQ